MRAVSFGFFPCASLVCCAIGPFPPSCSAIGPFFSDWSMDSHLLSDWSIDSHLLCNWSVFRSEEERGRQSLNRAILLEKEGEKNGWRDATAKKRAADEYAEAAEVRVWPLPSSGVLVMPGRSMSGFHRPGRHCLLQARGAVRCPAT